MEANNNPSQDPAAANAPVDSSTAAAPLEAGKEETKPEVDTGNEFSVGPTRQVESQVPPVPANGEAPAAPPIENEFAAQVVASIEVKDVPKAAEAAGEETDAKMPAEIPTPKEEVVVKAETDIQAEPAAAAPSSDSVAAAAPEEPVQDPAQEAPVKDTPLYDGDFGGSKYKFGKGFRYRNLHNLWDRGGGLFQGDWDPFDSPMSSKSELSLAQSIQQILEMDISYDDIAVEWDKLSEMAFPEFRDAVDQQYIFRQILDESNHIALSKVYTGFGPYSLRLSTLPNPKPEYMMKAQETVAEQLLKGGKRLAIFLEKLGNVAIDEGMVRLN